MDNNINKDSFTWENFWGDKAEYDVALDCEVIYEKSTGKSCVFWTSDEYDCPTDDINRPNEYITHGYTSDFESWGINICERAWQAGCRNVDECMKFIVDKCKNI